MNDDQNRTGIVAARRPHGDMDISWNRDIVDGLVRHSDGTGAVPLLTHGDKGVVNLCMMMSMSRLSKKENTVNLTIDIKYCLF